MKTQAEVDLEMKQLDTRAEKIELKEKELTEKEKELNEKEKKLEFVEQKLAQCVKDYELIAKKLASFCQQGNPDQHVDLAPDYEKLIELMDDESASAAMEPVHEERQSTTEALEKSEAKSIIPHEQESEAKRQRLIVNHQLRDKSDSSQEQIQESRVKHQPGDIATHPSSNDNILSGSINVDMLRELVKKKPQGESEDLFNALKCTQDPAKLVLDTSMALCPTNPEGSYEFKLLITSANCFLLLNQLKKLMPQIGNTVKDDAKKLAVYWKDKFSQSKQCNLEVICFLEFLGIFGIVSEFKANVLLGLLNNSDWRTVSPDLCQFLGLENAIPGFIHNLIKTGHRLKAVNYIYSLDMVNKFRPVSTIIKDSLRITKEFAEKSFREAKNEYSAQVAAIDRHINSLRNAIKCIKSHKLESEFESENLEERLNSLLKVRGNTSDGFGSKPDLTIQQSKTTKPTNAAEVGSVTKNSPLEPSTAAASSSASKPSRKMLNTRGRKRSLSGRIQSSGHVASLTRNYIPVASLTTNHFSVVLTSNPFPVASLRSNQFPVASLTSNPLHVASLTSNPLHVASLTSNPLPVASLTSNHFPRHVYSLNQRQTFPVNNGVGAFTVAPNPNYNHNQLRQPEGPRPQPQPQPRPLPQPQLPPFYQHLEPFFKNH